MDDIAPRRFFFCHLQKTGGLSLVRRLRREFSRARVYPRALDDAHSVLSVARLLKHWRESNGTLELVAGHFPLCTRELLGGAWLTFTVLREPVERTLSFLRHHRHQTPADRDKTLEAVYEKRLTYHGLIHNHMVKMLSLSSDEMTTAGALTPVSFTPGHLERAKERLIQVDVVGVQECFDEFCATLVDRFGFDLGPPVTRNRSEPCSVSASFRDRIATDNALDVELYRWAVASGVVCAGARTPAAQSIVR